MKTSISAFMLERYRLGELSPEDQSAISEALATNEELRARIKQLDESDRELRLRYPLECIQFPMRRFVRTRTAARTVRLAGLAALVAAGILLPVLYFTRTHSLKPNSGTAVAVLPHDVYPSERTKGRTLENCELSLYLKGEQETALSDQIILEEGNTVQLAYTAPAGPEYYGVIFSIDGRSVVTMHYPYRMGQSSLLVSGKRTFLDEAYTLDDAPEYEIFVLVVSEQPLDVQTVLQKAHEIAGETETIAAIAEKSKTAFEGCVETIAILKK